MNYTTRLLVLTTLCTGTLSPTCAPLVNIRTAIPSIVCDIRYATTNNFTGTQVYTHPCCYLVQPAAEALSKVQTVLAKTGLGLKVWDAYRPFPAQQALWDLVPDERYVSDPRKGGRHTRGTAVDCTLISLGSGREAVMPTGFDNFTERAWRSSQCDPLAAVNSSLLAGVMEAHGFEGLPTEWWHFDLRGWEDYDVLDVTFDQLVGK